MLPNILMFLKLKYNKLSLVCEHCETDVRISLIGTSGAAGKP